MTWKLYADAGLTVDLTAGWDVAQPLAGGAVDVQAWFGSTAAGLTLQAASAPGFDPITLAPVDAASGSGIETSMVRLATSAGGLDSATPGAPLTIGVTLSSGVENAVPVWLRVDAGALAAGLYADMSLQLVETV